VPVRAIGYRAPADFEGEVAMVFYGTDRATVTVARPPEPAEEAPPMVAPETPTEPAPLADPDVTPPGGGQPAPDSAPVPEDEPGPPPSN
jgi:hypothetical protein